MLTDKELIIEFVEYSLRKKQILLSNSALRAESVYDSNQMIAKNEGIILKMNFNGTIQEFLLKKNSCYWSLISEALVGYNFILTGKIDRFGFYSFQYDQIPQKYQVMCTKSVVLWKMWWKHRNNTRGKVIPLELLVRKRNSWYPVRDLVISQGLIYITTLGTELTIAQDDWVTWLRAKNLTYSPTVEVG